VPTLQVATATCASNIAVIKYWGKRDSKLLLPINSSLSVTLDPDRMGTTTTAAVGPHACEIDPSCHLRVRERPSRPRAVHTSWGRGARADSCARAPACPRAGTVPSSRARTERQVSPDWEGDRLWLNGKEEDVNAQRIQNCIREIRKRAGPPLTSSAFLHTRTCPRAHAHAHASKRACCIRTRMHVRCTPLELHSPKDDRGTVSQTNPTLPYVHGVCLRPGREP